MSIIKSFIYALIVTAALLVPFLPIMAWDCCESLDISVEGRVAYFHPSSSKVRRIYGDGWADYQLEISKGVYENLRIWAGVNGFSRGGESKGFHHHHTRLQLIPINFGLKYYIPFCTDFNFYLSGAASYSFLRIKDNSHYVHEHTHKNGWGGLVQAGITYDFWRCAYVNLFAEGFFQEFDFHNSHGSSGYGSYNSSSSRFIKRHKLDMSGYKLGVGIGYTF